MCVAVIKPKGVAMPSRKILRQCFSANDDGAGFMWARNGSVFIRKGYMSFRKFWKALRSLNLSITDSVVLHFRIGTAGITAPSMCHPFPLTDDERLLKATQVRCDVGMAHNGVIGRGDGELSDTAVLVRDSLAYFGDKIFDTPVLNLLDAAESYSKFVFLKGDGSFITTGHWTETDGVRFSNCFWKYRDTGVVWYNDPSRQGYVQKTYPSGRTYGPDNKPSTALATTGHDERTWDEKWSGYQKERARKIAKELQAMDDAKALETSLEGTDYSEYETEDEERSIYTSSPKFEKVYVCPSCNALLDESDLEEAEL